MSAARKLTEGDLFEALYWTQYGQGSATVRHASVGEPHQYVTRGVQARAQHGVRRIDALVIKRNVSKGDALWAVEIKVSAADLRRELSMPEKTLAWAQYTHAFYFLVTGELEALALDIVPKEFGVMVANSASWYRVARRARRNPSPLPLPLDTWRRLAASLGAMQANSLRAARFGGRADFIIERRAGV